MLLKLRLLRLLATARPAAAAAVGQHAPAGTRGTRVTEKERHIDGDSRFVAWMTVIHTLSTGLKSAVCAASDAEIAASMIRHLQHASYQLQQPFGVCCSPVLGACCFSPEKTPLLPRPRRAASLTGWCCTQPVHSTTTHIQPQSHSRALRRGSTTK